MIEPSVITAPPAQHTTITTPRPRIGPPWVVALLLVLYFGLAAIMGTQTSCDNDYGGVFLPSARFVLAGRPLDMYQVVAGGNNPNPAYPNANGPVGEVIIAGVLVPGRALGLQKIAPICPITDPYPVPQDSIPLHLWVILIFALILLGIAAELMRLLDRWQPRPFTGWQRGLLWALILVSPPMWDSMIFYGHYEQLLALYFGLLAVRAYMGRKDAAGNPTGQHFALSGILLALGLLCRTSDIFVAIPLGLVLLYEQRWWGALRYVLGGVITVGAILLPFYLHDRKDLLYSLSGFRGALGIGDGSFWTFFRSTPLEKLVQPLDSTTGLVAATVMCVVLIWVGRVRSTDAAIYALVCASCLWFPLSIKAVWGYYFADPLIWGLAWALTRPMLRQRWWEPIFITVFFSVLMVLTEYRVQIVQEAHTGSTRTLVLLESGAECVTLLLFALLLGVGIAFAHRPTQEFRGIDDDLSNKSAQYLRASPTQ